MPPPRLPLTPASSTEITPMDKASGPPGELSFSLPPAALSPASQRPKKRSASDVDAEVGIDLPPPPTRSRKIIQMQPKEEESSKSGAKSRESGAGKKKPSASTAAGRKIARKTAHSLIERRRRSKMNEEFATLKDMIPACKGQDMHKLAILQASIEYMNYLEQCISDLKAANANRRKDESTSLPDWNGPSRHAPSPSTSTSTTPETSPAISPSDQSQFRSFHLQFTPPEININTNVPCHASSASLDSLPVLPSPSLPAHRESFSRHSDYSYSPTNTLPPLSLNTIISPHIRPQTQPTQPGSTRLDHEASAALLMLNSHDRRTQHEERRKSGISVHDLLSH